MLTAKMKMREGFSKFLFLFFFILIGFAIIVSGCGKKDLPVPSGNVAPPAVNDLIKIIDGDTLSLTWTIPGEKEMFPSDGAGFFVYRSKKTISESDCKDCPVTFSRVADIPLNAEDLEKEDEGIKYNEILEKGYRYVFKVNTYIKGITSDDSNKVGFVFN